MVEIYALIVNVDVPINRLVASMTHSALTPDAKAALFSDAVSAGNCFRKRYAEVSVLVPELIVDKLQAFDDLIWQNYIMASVYGKDQTPSDRITLAQEADWAPVRAELRSIRVALRRTLGDVEAERRTDDGKGSLKSRREEPFR